MWSIEMKKVLWLVGALAALAPPLALAPPAANAGDRVEFWREWDDYSARQRYEDDRRRAYYEQLNQTRELERLREAIEQQNRLLQSR
jgi:hypothetical protein